MANRQPICQMCRGEICALCREKITQCKCPCPNFVICKICSVQEQTLPFGDDPVYPSPAKSIGSMGSKISPSMSPMMAIAMMMMNNMNKGKSCDCDKRSNAVPRVGPRKSKSKECCHKKPSTIEICCCPTASKNACQCGDTAPQRLCRCEEAKPAFVPPPHPHGQPQQGPTCVCAESHREPICHTLVRPDCDSRGLQRRQQYSYAPAQQQPCQQVRDYICHPTQQYPHRFEENPPRYSDSSRYGDPSETPQSRRTTQGPPDRRKTQDLRYDENSSGRSPSQILLQEDEPEPLLMSPREDNMPRKSPSPRKSTAAPLIKPSRKDSPPPRGSLPKPPRKYSPPPRESPPKAPRKDSAPPRDSPPKLSRKDSSPPRGSPPQPPRKDSASPRKSPRESGEVSRQNPPKPISQPPRHGSMVTHKA